MKLRDYQQNAIAGIYSYFNDKSGNPIIIAPTGAGKSVMIAKFVEEVVTAWPDQRILMLTHVKELVEQNFERLLAVWPAAPAGVNAASLNRRDTDHPIIFASIQSVYKRGWELGRFNLVLVDECHLIPDNGEGMYNKLLADLKRFNPKLKVVGFTATPFRMKSGHLIGEKTLFTDIAFEIPITTLLDQGHLSKVIPKATDRSLDVSGVKIRGGEFVAGELEKAVDTDELNEAIVCEIIKSAEDRKKWLVFCAGVSHAKHVRDKFRAKGVTCETITGSTPKQEREHIIERFKRGEITALTNVNVLTTGFDVPDIDLLACLRPTMSAGLWIQMVGRGMRTAPGKKNCLVLDFAGNTMEHGPIDKIKGKKKKKGQTKGEAPAKKCPECSTLVGISERECIECGYEFPEPERTLDLNTKASSAALLSIDIKPIKRTFTAANLSLHTKPGKPDILKVTLMNGHIRIADDYLCLEHGGFAEEKARKRFKSYFGFDAPGTSKHAIESVKKAFGCDIFGRIEIQRAVELEKNGKFLNVKKVLAA